MNIPRTENELAPKHQPGGIVEKKQESQVLNLKQIKKVEYYLEPSNQL